MYHSESTRGWGHGVQGGDRMYIYGTNPSPSSDNFSFGWGDSIYLPLPKKAALDLCHSKHPAQVPSRGPPAPSADMTAESEPAVAAAPSQNQSLRTAVSFLCLGRVFTMAKV